MSQTTNPSKDASLRILVHGGDNMLGRAVQLTFPVQAPGESLVKDSCTAQHYLDISLNHASDTHKDLTEIKKLNGNRGEYLWGDYRGMQINPAPDLRILNLETAVTKSIDNVDVPTSKGINYHMHSDNYENIMSGFCQETHAPDQQPSPVIVNCANNHGIDYGRIALERETLPLLQMLNTNEFQTIGLGHNLREVMKPATVTVGPSATPVEMFCFSAKCSGTPSDWFATETRSGLLGLPGIYSLKDVDEAIKIAKRAFQYSKSPSLRIVSIHWGPNWAKKHEYSQQLRARRELAHRLIDECGVDLIYGHSSHHVRGMEVYRNKLIIYGAGDIINDYEGFENRGEEQYNRLGGIFLVDLQKSTGNFEELRVIPMHMNRLQLKRVTTESAIWRPQQHRLDRDPNKIQDFCSFVNEMSNHDAFGQALMVEYCESDPQTPGGQILRSKHP